MKLALSTAVLLSVATTSHAVVTANGGRANEDFNQVVQPLNGVTGGHANVGTYISTGSIGNAWDIQAGSLMVGPQIAITPFANAGSSTRTTTGGFGEAHTPLLAGFNAITGNYKENWISFDLTYNGGHFGLGITDSPFSTLSATPKIDQSGATPGDVPSEKEGFGMRIDSNGNLFATTWEGVDDNVLIGDQSDDISLVQNSATSLSLASGTSYKIYIQSVMGDNASGDEEQITVWAVTEADMVDGLGNAKPVYLRDLSSVTVTNQIRNFDIKAAGQFDSEMFLAMFATLNPVVDNVRIGWLNGTNSGNYPGTANAADRDAARQDLIANRSPGEMLAFDALLGNPYVNGDVNLDGQINPLGNDIDTLFGQLALGNTHEVYDVNGDLSVNSADADHLVQVVYGSNYGDANLDGTVDEVDFGTIAANQGQTDALWRDGEMTGDGEINLSDFGRLAFNFGAAAVPVTAVPEPGSLALLGLGGLAMTRRRRTA